MLVELLAMQLKKQAPMGGANDVPASLAATSVLDENARSFFVAHSS